MIIRVSVHTPLQENLLGGKKNAELGTGDNSRDIPTFVCRNVHKLRQAQICIIHTPIATDTFRVI